MPDADAHTRYGKFLIQLIVKRKSLTSPFLELGESYIEKEKWDKARKSFEQAMAMVEDLMTTGDEVQANCLKGATLVCMGAQNLCEEKFAKAHEYFARSERPFRNGKEFYGCAVALLANGLLCELNTDWREVFFYYDRAEKMLLGVADADSKELFQMVQGRHENARKLWQRSFDDDSEPPPLAPDSLKVDSVDARGSALLPFLPTPSLSAADPSKLNPSDADAGALSQLLPLQSLPASPPPQVDSQAVESGTLLQFLPIFGSIPAGDPRPIPQYVTGYVGTDRIFINENPYAIQSNNHLPLRLGFSPEIAYVTMQVRGDSMNNAGINDGNYAILRIERTSARLQPKDGDIVAVVLPEDDVVTLKRFHRGENKVSFQPESSNPIHETREFPSIGEFDVGLRVVGILVAVLVPASPA